MVPYSANRESSWSRHWTACTVLIAVGFAACVAPLQADELNDFRAAVRDKSSPPPDPSPPKKAKKSHSHGYGCHCGDCCDDDESLDASLAAFMGIVIGGAITTPWWGPVLMLEDDYNIEGHFARRPYQGELDGYMMMEPWVPEEPFGWSGRASVEYATSFDDLSNVNAKFLLETSSRWGLDSEITYRTEDLGGGVEDHLTTGDLNLVFRFAQSQHAQFRTGIGANWLSDDVGDEFGFNFTYAFDLYPARPWVLSNELDWGRLGEAHLFHWRSTAGWMIHSGEVYIGVDYFDVGPMDMTTMVSGVRFWF